MTDWETVKPFFSKKVKSSIVLNLVEKWNIIDNEKDITTIFNSYFTNIVLNRFNK